MYETCRHTSQVLPLQWTAHYELHWLPSKSFKQKTRKVVKQPRNSFKPAPSNAWSNPEVLAQVKAPTQPQAPMMPLSLTPQLPTNQAPLQAHLHSGTYSLILNQITQMISTFISQLNAVLQSSQVGQYITRLF
ncbi:hypothetical protein AVEN_268884-1 [Araneus ventricosus]|uniref:Uncharacterized protein n=1 Tax=Araneus ventricosus TaxID=182803 RepID=A0A4Y2EUR8_ARAVE|nr:hypothetical protein AVEN_268884-1 [Araneus ventricosus]